MSDNIFYKFEKFEESPIKLKKFNYHATLLCSQIFMNYFPPPKSEFIYRVTVIIKHTELGKCATLVSNNNLLIC